MCSLWSLHFVRRKQIWLWAQGDLYRARPDYCRPGNKSGVDDISTYTRRSPSLRRSVLKSRQEYEIDVDDDSVSNVTLTVVKVKCAIPLKGVHMGCPFSFLSL